MNLRNQSSRRTTPAVKQKNDPQHNALVTKLVPTLVRCGEREGFFHLPVCDVCHKPVLDFESANVVVKDSSLSAGLKPLESLGFVGDTEFFRVPGIAVAVHLDCDRGEFKPWVRATSVFCCDQRSPIEKLGFAVGS